MSVSVSMPQLGESVTEGTVTRWLKREGERVEADEPLLEVSTDKVDTEIPSPVSGILRGITVAEDETVAVGAELAVIDEEGAAPAGGGSPEAAPEPAQAEAPAAAPQAAAAPPQEAQQHEAQPQQPQQAQQAQQPATQPYQQPAYQAQQPAAAPAAYQQGYAEPAYQPQEAAGYQQGTAYPAATAPAQDGHPYAPQAAAPPPAAPPAPPAPAPAAQPPSAPPENAQSESARPESAGAEDTEPDEAGAADTSGANGAESPYVTPLVRKLATEHGVDLAAISGTGVGGRIRKQDVLDAARVPRQQAAPEAPSAQAAEPAPAAAAPAPPPAAAADTERRPARAPVVESRLRGTTERMSRARQVIAQRMVESLQTSAQLTTVVEADVTAIARLRDRAKAAFEAREGVKLSFLPFFALATVEALKEHPKLNAVIDTASGQVTYHDAEHLGIAVDTERGLMVPVIRNAGDLNIGGLARKIADLAARTRAGQVSPDDLAGGTFTLTNTGSRGALFDTPIINQPQVGILGTGTVVKRAVVVEDPTLGEVITVRSMVYLALTYDHRLVDGADAARFLTALKARLEEGVFETEVGR
jgi:2-oxoglutarate dehydrogenase E2 component (dihydrolipoamide succinyltransferase)